MLKPGYKQTDLGVLPEEWEVSALGPLLLRKPDYGINAAAVTYSSVLPAYLRITDISETGEFMPEGRASVDHALVNSYFLEANDIVLARTGASVGKSYLYNPKDGRLVYAGFLIRVKANPQKLDARFLKYNLQTDQYWQWVAMTSMRSGQPGINGNEYAQLQIPLPPPAEQQAIAETLGAVDALLTAQRELLAKKRDLKQATQQALLSGERRLPGFGGEWEEKTLGDCFDKVVGGGTPSRGVERFWGGPIPWVTVKDLSSFDAYKAQESITVEALRSSASHLIPKGTLIISTRMAVGRAVIYAVDVAINQDLKALYTNSSVDRHFLYYWLQLEEENIASGATGSTVKGLQVGDLKALVVNLPPIAEQRAIAAILSDMDAELEALAAQLAKTQALKQGLMQDLLTGRLRLGQGGAAPTVPLAV